MCIVLFFVFKQKTAYELRISDWSSDVCSSDLAAGGRSGRRRRAVERVAGRAHGANEIVLTTLVQCLAQAADVHIDGARLDVDVAAPDRIQELLASEYPPRMLHQVAQQAELRRPEADVLPVALAAVGRPVRSEARRVG